MLLSSGCGLFLLLSALATPLCANPVPRNQSPSFDAIQNADKRDGIMQTARSDLATVPAAVDALRMNEKRDQLDTRAVATATEAFEAPTAREAAPEPKSTSKVKKPKVKSKKSSSKTGLVVAIVVVVVVIIIICILLFVFRKKIAAKLGKKKKGEHEEQATPLHQATAYEPVAPPPNDYHAPAQHGQASEYYASAQHGQAQAPQRY